MTVIKPGVIPDRVPRPLTNEERAKLPRADPKALKALERKFAKPEGHLVPKSKTEKPRNNGWGA